MSYVVDENGEQNTELNRSSNFSMSRSSLSESKFLPSTNGVYTFLI